MKWLEQQVSKRRVKRDAGAQLFNDPLWPRLWYLVSGIMALQAEAVTVCCLLKCAVCISRVHHSSVPNLRRLLMPVVPVPSAMAYRHLFSRQQSFTHQSHCYNDSILCNLCD